MPKEKAAKSGMTPPAGGDKPLGRAGFLGWAFGFVGLIALSVVGMAHSRQLRGEANLQFWIVVALVAAALAAIAFGLARTPAATRRGELLRSAAVGAATVAIALFLWETIALGSGVTAPPSRVVAALLGF